MNSVSLCDSCGDVIVVPNQETECVECGGKMRTQAEEWNGVRRGLLRMYQTFFNDVQTFVPVIVDESIVNIITSNVDCPELARFCSECELCKDQCATTNTVSVSSQRVLTGKSRLYNAVSEMTRAEIAEYTSFVFG